MAPVDDNLERDDDNGRGVPRHVRVVPDHRHQAVARVVHPRGTVETMALGHDRFAHVVGAGPQGHQAVPGTRAPRAVGFAHGQRSNPHRVWRRGHRGPRSLPAGAHSRGPSVQPIPRPSTRPVGHPAARRRTPPGRDPGRGMTHHRRIRALDCECSRLAAKAPPPRPRRTGRAPHGRLPTASTPTSRAGHRPSSTRRATLARRRPAPL